MNIEQNGVGLAIVTLLMCPFVLLAFGWIIQTWR